MTAPAELLVCIKCRKGAEIPETETRPGRALHDALLGKMPEGVTLRPVECMSNCSDGCTVALRGDGRWTYVLGNLDEAADADMLAGGAALYAAAPDGLIPWRARPEHFKRNTVSRTPPLDYTDPSLES